MGAPKLNSFELDRRTLLASILALASPFPAHAFPSAEILPLWLKSPPGGGGGPKGRAIESAKGALTNVGIPKLDVFRPQRSNGAAILIAAGGGYKRIEDGAEALPAARWLTTRGITAFVLTYRLPTEGWSAGPAAPLQDAQRALRIMRADAKSLWIDETRIGALGFSAGAHLMGMASARSDLQSYEPVDRRDDASSRPAATALIYPVITLKPPHDHTSSRVSLIGDHPSKVASAQWSVETYVKASTPPIFMAQAEDDHVVSPANMTIMAEACRRAHVDVEAHQIRRGGHGFGMGRPGTPTEAWPGWYENWLKRYRFLS